MKVVPREAVAEVDEKIKEWWQKISLKSNLQQVFHTTPVHSNSAGHKL